MKAEMIKMLSCFSLRSCYNLSDCLQAMFPGGSIAQNFSLAKTSCPYVKTCIFPYFYVSQRMKSSIVIIIVSYLVSQ